MATAGRRIGLTREWPHPDATNFIRTGRLAACPTLLAIAAGAAHYRRGRCVAEQFTQFGIAVVLVLRLGHHACLEVIALGGHSALTLPGRPSRTL